MNSAKERSNCCLAAAVVLLTSWLSGATTFAGTAIYEYDELGRLKTVTIGALVTTYKYDAAGNRTSTQTGIPIINHAPVCANRTVVLTGIPPMASTTATVTTSMVLQLCTDADGDTMTVTSPVLPRSMTLYAGQSFVTNFVVSDGRGGAGSGTFTFSRP